MYKGLAELPAQRRIPMADIVFGKQGETTFTGAGINAYQLIVLKSALRMKAKGLNFSAKVNPIKAAQRLGFKGRTAAELLPQVEKALEESRKTVTVARE
jgi:hypothetical protein